MDVERLQDRISFGMGVAARKYGSPYVIYRPSSIDRPLREHNIISELLAAFQPSGRITGGGLNAVVWEASFDSHYSVEGDYLVGDGGIFFVAMQRPALPVRCVLTNCIVTVVRPAFAAQGSYNGLCDTGGTVIINEWPGHLEAGRNTSADGGPMLFTVRSLMLPKLPADIQVADLITGDGGYNNVVMSVEQNAMGWHVIVRSGTP